MKDKLILLLKGFVMGIANIIPGVSGGTLAITLGIYEKLIASISHFFSNFKENIKFLIPVGLGMVLSILCMSGVISECFKNIPIPTIMFFMGLVIGGVPLLVSKVKGSKETGKISSYVIFLITFSIVMILAFSEQVFGVGQDVNLTNLGLIDFILLFIVGMITAGTMVIPGVSGSLVLMLLGYYFPVLDVIKSLFKFENLGSNLMVVAFFGIGVLVGIILIAKLIEFLFKKFEIKTYFGVLGFILASVIAIPVSVYNELGGYSFNLIGFIIGIVMMGIGSIIGYKLGEK